MHVRNAVACNGLQRWLLVKKRDVCNGRRDALRTELAATDDESGDDPPPREDAEEGDDGAKADDARAARARARRVAVLKVPSRRP